MRNIHLNPFWVDRHVLISRLSPEQCRERLEAQRVPLFWQFKRMPIPSESQVQGRISSRGFSIYRYTHYWSSFKTVASGKLTLVSGRAHIAVRLSLPWWLVVFMTFYLAFALLMEAIIVLLDVFSFGTRTGPAFLPELVPLVLATWAVALYVLGRRKARGDDDFLLNFLKETLDAEEIGV